MLKCDDCEFDFDERDTRCVNLERQDKTRLQVCPACRIMSIGSVEGWAVWNSCQGIFTDTVRGSRDEAAIALRLPPFARSEECDLVPVRVIVEPKDKHDFRHWQENEKDGRAQQRRHS